MFRDYYEILEINQNASPEEIKLSFKRQALKWHPDRHQGIDTTAKMQAINEAKLILLDEEGRIRYDAEYNIHINQKKVNATTTKDSHQEDSFENSSFGAEESIEENEEFIYHIYDEELHRWMNNAQRQSVDLAKKTIEEFKGMVNEGVTATVKEAFSILTINIVLGFIITFFILLSRACNI